ncbi:MAG: ATP-binding protein [Planctomycetota bacterium]
MSLTTKTAVTLTALVLGIAAAGALLRQRAFDGAFTGHERAAAARNVEWVTQAIDAEVDELSRVAARYGAWNRAYDFIFAERLRAGFERENIQPAALRAQELDLLYFCELDGDVAGGLALDPATGRPTRLELFPPTTLPATHPVFETVEGEAESEPSGRQGILITERGPLLVATAPVTGLGADPRRRGTVIAGRFLGDRVRERIERRTGLGAAIWSVGGPDVADDVVATAEDVRSSPGVLVRPGDEPGTLLAFAAVQALTGEAALLVRTSSEQEVTEIARGLLDAELAMNLALALAAIVLLLLAIHLQIVRPIRRVASRARRALDEVSPHERFGANRRDEIGDVERSLDDAFVQLDQARSVLVETSRTAGLSEIATGILHNVGNVLNSVNISASLVSQRIEGLCIDDLERLSQVLAEHADDLPTFLTSDPRGQHIQPFLSALVVQLGEEQQTIRTEVESLANGIDHICELVKSQQDMAKGARLVERTDLAERFDEALRITQRVHGHDPNLVVVRRYEDVPEIELDKHKLLEILVNLVQNARQAMAARESERELALEIRRVDDDRVMLAVEDNGIGISQDDLERVFSMGFTTREEGHGFGLHSSANAASEMGGRLGAESDGPGEGARFLLELPVEPPAEPSLVTTETTDPPAAEEGAQ